MVARHSAVSKVQLIMIKNRKVTIIPVSEHNVNDDNRNALVTFQEDRVQMNSNGTQGANVRTSLNNVSYDSSQKNEKDHTSSDCVFIVI